LKKNLSDYLVALVVIACSLVLLAALTIALSGYQLKKPTRTLEVDYSDVSGIHVSSELRYAGAPAGHVIAMRHLTSDERKTSQDPRNAVRVTVSINAEVPPFPADVKASLGSDTLLSDKFIALSAGTADGKTLANAAVIQGQSGGSIDQLLQDVGPLFQKVSDLLSDVQGDLKNVLPKLSSTLDSAQQAVNEAQGFIKNANSLVADKGSLRQVIENLKTVETNLDEVLQKAGGFVGNTDHDLAARMKELSVVLQNLKVATTHLKAFGKALGEKPNRVIFSGKPEKLQPEEAILKSSQPLPAKP
jgi:ABC-type transporter Mla subunit MlaD